MRLRTRWWIGTVLIRSLILAARKGLLCRCHEGSDLLGSLQSAPSKQGSAEDGNGVESGACLQGCANLQFMLRH